VQVGSADERRFRVGFYYAYINFTFSDGVLDGSKGVSGRQLENAFQMNSKYRSFGFFQSFSLALQSAGHAYLPTHQNNQNAMYI
jgi:hypothetical protein